MVVVMDWREGRCGDCGVHAMRQAEAITIWLCLESLLLLFKAM